MQYERIPVGAVLGLTEEERKKLRQDNAEQNRRSEDALRLGGRR